MRLKTVYSAMILVAILVLVACNANDTKPVNSNTSYPPNSAVGPPTTHASSARRITTAELETLMKEGKAYVVDVRTQDSYNMGHIPGSVLIPATEVYKHADKLPRDKTIVTYCS